MLAELYIKNFAIIDELRVSLGPGLNVLTGETGAGKSIIVDALGATLGQRVGSEMVRTGADQAIVEGLFDLGAPGDQIAAAQLQVILAEHGMELEDGTLILGREVNRATGRTTARVNSRAVPLSVLQQLGQLLVDIHGQSEHLSLLRVKEHVDYLDRYAGLMELRGQVAQAARELRSVRAEMEKIARDERESAREIDLLTYQLQEIQGAKLEEGEEERLQSERTRLHNTERLRELAFSISTLLNGTEEQAGAVDQVVQSDKLYSELSRLDPEASEDQQALEEARFALEEVARKASDYADSLEDDPARLNEVEERLELLSGLKRKYGRTVAEVLAYGADAQERLERLSNRAFYLDELRQTEAGLLEKLGGLALSLSEQRRGAAGRLAEEIQTELADLNMKGTSFRVAFAVAADPQGVVWPAEGAPAGDEPFRVAVDSSGADRVEFLVSPNPGEEPKGLAKIASGGEMARLMLALKTILSKADAIPTLVFDEIDVGVGARSGVRVGEKLWRLTGTHQVLCITHMPQIASVADTHLSVAKIVNEGRTRTDVTALAGGSAHRRAGGDDGWKRGVCFGPGECQGPVG